MGPRRVTIGSLGNELDRAGGFERLEGFGSASTTKRSRAGGTSKRRLRGGRALLVVCAVALCGLAAGAVAIHMLVDPDAVGRWIAPRASNALGREVTVGQARLGLLPRPALRLEDVRVGNAEGFTGPALAAVDRVRFDIALPGLLRGRVDLSRVRMEGVRVHMAVDEAGVSNFGDLVPEGGLSLPATGAPVSFSFRDVAFADAGLTYFDAPRERSFAIAGASGAFDVRPDGQGGWTVEGSGASDSLHVRAPRVTEEILRTAGPRFTLLAGGDGTFDWVDVESAVVEQSGETLSIRGRLEGFTSDRPFVDLRIGNPRLAASVITSFMPKAARSRSFPSAEGSLAVALRLRGPLGGLDERPQLSGTVGLADVGVRLNGQPLITGVAGTVELDADTVSLDSISGRFADGPFELTGAFIGSRRDVVASVVASPDLGALDRLGIASGAATLAGAAYVELSVAGSLERVDSMAVDGTVRLTGMRFEHPRIGVPIYLPAAALRVERAEVVWEELTFLVGEEPLRSSGRLAGLLPSWLGDATPVATTTVRAERLTLGQVIATAGAEPDGAVPGGPEPDGAVPGGAESGGVAPTGAEPAPTYAQIAFAHLGGREVSGRRAATAAAEAGLRRPRTLPLHGELDVEIGSLLHHGREIRSLVARVALTDSTISVRDGGFELWEGSLRGSLVLGVGERLDEPFALELDGEGVDAATFFSAMTPMGDAVSGELALAVDLTGTTDLMLLPLLETLGGSATLTISDGEIAETGVNLALADFLAAEEWSSVPFTSWISELSVREGMMQVERSELRGPSGRARLSGVVGFGGAVDLAMGLSIPPDRLRAVSLRRTGVAQSVLDHLRTTSSPLDLGIRLSGSLEGPTLEPDALAATEQPTGR
jgi:hypothetical protein